MLSCGSKGTHRSVAAFALADFSEGKALQSSQCLKLLAQLSNRVVSLIAVVEPVGIKDDLRGILPVAPAPPCVCGGVR